MGKTRPYMVGIAGPSGSGKTHIAHALSEHVGHDRCVLISCDSYYHDLSRMPLAERAETNFDHPDAIDADMLAVHLQRLRRGESIAAPTYSFETHTRLPDAVTVAPMPVTIVEGLHVLNWPRVRELLDLKVFIEASHDLCLARRIERDVRERGRTEESCREQFERTVAPMAEAYVIPSTRFADIIVHGAGPVDRAVRAIAGAWAVDCRRVGASRSPKSR